MGFCFVFCQWSNVGNGRLNSEETRICLIYLVDVCYFEVMLRWWLFDQKPGCNYLVATCGTVLEVFISFVGGAEEQCLLTGWHVEQDGWIPEQIGSLVGTNDVCNFYCG